MRINRILLALLIAVAVSQMTQTMAAPTSGYDTVQLEGTWSVTVNISAPGFPPSFLALETYGHGGGMVTSNNLPPVQRPGQGAWAQSGREYDVSIAFFTFDQNGAPSGSIKVRHRISLVGKDEYAGTGEASFYDADGNLLFALPFTSQAHRLMVEQ